MMNQENTIAALATALGGGIAIIRISGENSLKVAESAWSGKKSLKNNPHKLLFGKTADSANATGGEHCLAVFMPNPHSYTGEDVVEIHCHGGNFSAQNVLKMILSSGAEHAEPGEFTKRAFINGKLDLTQAEAVNDLICARSNSAMNLAIRQLNGKLGDSINELYENLISIHAEIEVRMDFTDEDLDWTSPQEIDKIFQSTELKINQLLESRNHGEILRNGIDIVIAGPPNAGKSSLMNSILGRSRAIVTDIPGTTRDTLSENVQINGIPIHLTDSAGIHKSDDPIENSGIERSFEALRTAQIILWLVDFSNKPEKQLPELNLLKKTPFIIVFNKTDLTQKKKTIPAAFKFAENAVFISIKENDGLDNLFLKIENMVWKSPNQKEPEFAVNARHASLLYDSLKQIKECKNVITSEDWELAAVHLRQSINSLGKILGKTIQDDILSTIFSKYCIGK